MSGMGGFECLLYCEFPACLWISSIWRFFMNGIAKTFAFICMVNLLAGCATVSSSYTPPKPYDAPNRTIVINQSKDDVWASVVQALGENFFVINNLDKESGLINVSYNTDTEKYCDCGRIHAEYHYTQKEVFDFPAAQKVQEYKSKLPNGRHTIIRRNMTLEGRMNILIAEEMPPRGSVE
jgi:hypothetical protein